MPAPGARPDSNLTCVALRELDAQRDAMHAGEARGLGGVSDGGFTFAFTVISINLAPDRKVQRNRSSNLRDAYSYDGLTSTYLAPDRKVQRNRSSNLRDAYSYDGLTTTNLAPDRKVQRNRSSNLRGAYSYDGLTATYLAPDRNVQRNRSSNLRGAYSYDGLTSIDLVPEQRAQRRRSSILRGAHSYDGLANPVFDQKVRRDHPKILRGARVAANRARAAADGPKLDCRPCSPAGLHMHHAVASLLTSTRCRVLPGCA